MYLKRKIYVVAFTNYINTLIILINEYID